MNGCDYAVKLKPVKVFHTVDCFSEDIGEEIEMFGDYITKINWLKEGCFVINGERGEGVDIFWVMERTDGGFVVVTGMYLMYSFIFHRFLISSFSDQRKKVANCLEEDLGKQLIPKPKIVPKIGGKKCCAVSGLFSLHPNLENKNEIDMEYNSFIASSSTPRWSSFASILKS